MQAGSFIHCASFAVLVTISLSNVSAWHPCYDNCNTQHLIEIAWMCMTIESTIAQCCHRWVGDEVQIHHISVRTNAPKYRNHTSPRRGCPKMFLYVQCRVRTTSVAKTGILQSKMRFTEVFISFISLCWCWMARLNKWYHQWYMQAYVAVYLNYIVLKSTT